MHLQQIINIETFVERNILLIGMIIITYYLFFD